MTLQLSLSLKLDKHKQNIKKFLIQGDQNSLEIKQESWRIYSPLHSIFQSHRHFSSKFVEILYYRLCLLACFVSLGQLQIISSVCLHVTDHKNNACYETEGLVQQTGLGELGTEFTMRMFRVQNAFCSMPSRIPVIQQNFNTYVLN